MATSEHHPKEARSQWTILFPPSEWGNEFFSSLRTLLRKESTKQRLTEFHRVQPAVDVQDQVHLEGLGLAVESAHCIPTSSIARRSRGTGKTTMGDIIVRRSSGGKTFPRARGETKRRSTVTRWDVTHRYRRTVPNRASSIGLGSGRRKNSEFIFFILRPSAKRDAVIPLDGCPPAA